MITAADQKARKRGICALIAAFNAQDSIGAAVTSALEQPQVTEVIVVDDASRDATVSSALAADDGSQRLQVIRMDQNGGPAAARNVGLGRSDAAFVAILDADDRFLPGRFSNLDMDGEWDFFADNVVFLSRSDQRFERHADGAQRQLTFSEFVIGNISRRGKPRGELGFMKPVIRRAFLDRQGLEYDETLRLGEDYIFYARAFLADARFLTTSATGYAATIRPNSLSAVHHTADLAALIAADHALLLMPNVPTDAREQLRRHYGQVKAKYDLRKFLDEKNERGLGPTCANALLRPAAWLAIVKGVLSDKLLKRPERSGIHTLFPVPPIEATK